MSVLQDLADAQQERELEKVNAFYLQKEAEVSNQLRAHEIGLALLPC